MNLVYVNVNLEVNLDTGAINFLNGSGRPFDSKDDKLFSIGADTVAYMGNKYHKREDEVSKRDEVLVRKLSYSLIQ